MTTLSGKTVFITGASRGIGREIALRCAEDGANIVICAKTAEPHPKLSGTIFTVAQEVIDAGGHALAIPLDVRNYDQLKEAITKAVQTFGGIDILVNNAGAIWLAPTSDTPIKRFDLLMDINTRATFASSQLCMPYLVKSKNPHILNLAPPINLNKKWFKDHLAYTISKYGMSMCTLGMAEELRADGIAVNALWPKTTIATDAIEYNYPKEILAASRKARIVADAAYAIFARSSTMTTGNFFIDEQVLREEGICNFDDYALTPNSQLYQDLFIDD